MSNVLVLAVCLCVCVCLCIVNVELSLDETYADVSPVRSDDSRTTAFVYVTSTASIYSLPPCSLVSSSGGSVAEWLAYWTKVQ